MANERAPLLLQVCANDHPPFADICRFHAAAARSLGWRTVTVMLQTRAAAPAPDFHYPKDTLPRELPGLLEGRRPLLTLCHRYRAYRAVAACPFLGGPLVVAHEFDLLRRWQRRARLHLDRWRGRPPARFAGVSDAVAQELCSWVPESVLLPNGIDLSHADAGRLPRVAAQAELGLSQDDFNIGVVGRLHPKKNPALAVEVLRRTAPEMPDARLVFIGSGALEAQLATLAEGLPVLFKGFVPAAPQLLAGLDLLLITAGEREAFGMVALEAMAAGVPVLAGPAPGPRFVLGPSALPVASADAESLAAGLRAARAEQRAGALGQRARAARARVEREFSVTAGARRLAALVHFPPRQFPWALSDTGQGRLPDGS